MSTLKQISPSDAHEFDLRASVSLHSIQGLIDEYSSLRGINPYNAYSDEVRDDDLHRSLLQAVGGLQEFIEKIEYYEFPS